MLNIGNVLLKKLFIKYSSCKCYIFSVIKKKNDIALLINKCYSNLKMEINNLILQNI